MEYTSSLSVYRYTNRELGRVPLKGLKEVQERAWNDSNLGPVNGRHVSEHCMRLSSASLSYVQWRMRIVLQGARHKIVQEVSPYAKIVAE